MLFLECCRLPNVKVISSVSRMAVDCETEIARCWIYSVDFNAKTSSGRRLESHWSS